MVSGARGVRLCAWLTMVSLLVLLAGCDATLLHEVSEAEGTRLVVLLEQHGVASRLEASPGGGSGFEVVVAESELGRARAVLVANRLPAEDVSGAHEEGSGGVLGLDPRGAHRQEERARAARLEESLRRWGGVMDARVHLVVPREEPWGGRRRGGEGALARASVWLLVRDDVAVVDDVGVARFVASSVPGVEASGVSVMREVGEAPQVGEVVYERVGPWSVAPGSAEGLRWTLVGLVVAVIVSVGGMSALWLRRRRRDASI